MAFTALWKRLRPAQLLASSSPIWTSRAAPRSVSIRLQASFGLSSVSSLAGLLALQDTSKHLAAAEDKHRWRLRSRARTNFKRPLHHSNDCRQLRRLVLAQRANTHSVQPVPTCAKVQPVQQCGGTNASKPCSRATASAKKNNSKRDILRRNAIHASNRRVLLVPRESQSWAC